MSHAQIRPFPSLATLGPVCAEPVCAEPVSAEPVSAEPVCVERIPSERTAPLKRSWRGFGDAMRACSQARDARRDDAWSDLVARFGTSCARLQRHALRRRGFPARPSEVEDALQELWLRLLRAGDSFRGRTDAEAVAYVALCARHVACDRRRSTVAKCRAPEVDPASEHRIVRAVVRRGRGLRSWRDPWRPPTDCVTPETLAIRREAIRGFVESCRRTVRACAPQGRRRRGSTSRRVQALARAFVEGESSVELSRRYGGTPSAREIDRLAVRLRRRMRAQGVELPRRCGNLR